MKDLESALEVYAPGKKVSELAKEAIETIGEKELPAPLSILLHREGGVDDVSSEEETVNNNKKVENDGEKEDETGEKEKEREDIDRLGEGEKDAAKNIEG